MLFANLHHFDVTKFSVYRFESKLKRQIKVEKLTFNIVILKQKDKQESNFSFIMSVGNEVDWTC